VGGSATTKQARDGGNDKLSNGIDTGFIWPKAYAQL